MSGNFALLDLFNTRLDERLKKRAQELNRLTLMLRNELPPEVDGHFSVANIRDRTLVIMSDSPVWATRLRQLGPQIVNILQNNGKKNLLHIQVFSRPPSSPVARPPEPPQRPARKLSQQSTELINQTASYIEDENLREAMLKLAKRGSKPEAKKK
jgi:hypothetical protein